MKTQSIATKVAVREETGHVTKGNRRVLINSIKDE